MRIGWSWRQIEERRGDARCGPGGVDFFRPFSAGYSWSPAASLPAGCGLDCCISEQKALKPTSRPWLLQKVVVGVGDSEKARFLFLVATQLESLAKPAREHGKRGKQKQNRTQYAEREEREERETKSADRRSKPACRIGSCRFVSCRVRACS